jgi:septal ring factor EnvC (AmiA/AmiB activator)
LKKKAKQKPRIFYDRHVLKNGFLLNYVMAKWTPKVIPGGKKDRTKLNIEAKRKKMKLFDAKIGQVKQQISREQKKLAKLVRDCNKISARITKIRKSAIVTPESRKLGGAHNEELDLLQTTLREILRRQTEVTANLEPMGEKLRKLQQEKWRTNDSP